MEQTVIPTVHVEPSSDGRWAVRIAGRAPGSLHNSANEAEAVAREQAQAIGADTVVVRDRYRRVRMLRWHSIDH
jgi:hypothetical protein